MTSKPESFDVIVIGSGIGGMTAATLLAKANKRVLLLERHTVPGGFSHTFKRKGYEWDVGVHYVGQMESKFSILRKVLEYVTTAKKISWTSLGDVYDEARIAGKSYSFYSNFEKHQLELIRKFPAEEAAIRNYFKLVRTVASSGPWFFGEKTMPPFLSRTLGKLLRYRFEKYARKTTLEVMNTLTKDTELRAVLFTQCGDYGLAPEKSSFAIHAVVVAHYLDGACYPNGGAGVIPDSMLATFKNHGGLVRVKAEVARIEIKNGRVRGVTLKSGVTILSPIVISNAGFRNTFSKLVDPETLSSRAQDKISKTLSQISPSTAHLCLYVGLNGDDADLALPKNNIWVYDSRELTEENKKSLTYISFPSAKDSQWAALHPGKATVQVIRAADFSDVQNWSEENWPRRSADYLALKQRWTEELTATLLRELPHLKNRIAFTELSTPLSTKHFSNYSRGEIYGLEHTPARFANSLLRPGTSVKGLYLTGQDIVTVGFGGALYSGVLAATVALKKSVILRILLNRSL